MRTIASLVILLFMVIGIIACTEQSWRQQAVRASNDLPYSYSEVPWYEEWVASNISDSSLTPEAGEKVISFYSDLDAGKDFKWDLPTEIFIGDAEKGDAQAQTILGYQNLIGYNTPCDVCTSLRWFSKAALQNHPVANFFLATHFMNGFATVPNTELACWTVSLVEQHYGFNDMELPDDNDSVTQSTDTSQPLFDLSERTECKPFHQNGFSSDITQNFVRALQENSKLQACPEKSCPNLNGL